MHESVKIISLIYKIVFKMYVVMRRLFVNWRANKKKSNFITIFQIVHFFFKFSKIQMIRKFIFILI